MLQFTGAHVALCGQALGIHMRAYEVSRTV